MKTVEMYDCTHPNGQKFMAAVCADDNDNLYVYSNREGSWDRDKLFHWADLAWPQYDFNEWDIYPAKANQKTAEQPKVEKAFREQNPDVAKFDDNDDDDDGNRISATLKRQLATVEVEKGDKPSNETVVGDSEAGGLTQYLDMVSKMEKGQRGFAGFIREHGKSYAFDEDSFVGGGKSQQCFKNATDAAMADPDLTYVEGYISVHGVPVHHAWTVDKAGKVMDPTVSDPEGKLGYYGVPFTKRYLIDTMLETEHYGLMTDHSAEKTVFGDPAKMIKK